MRFGSDRKLRLVGCALCRVIWSELSALGRRAVEVAEAYADGLAGVRSRAAYSVRLETAGSRDSSRTPMWMPGCAVSETGWYAAELTIGCTGHANEECRIVRDIFGNPFRPITIDPRWLTSTVVDISNAIYDERAFDKMPILADALMDAGCDCEEILNHCRGDGPHVRGCWVVDLLLGKK